MTCHPDYTRNVPAVQNNANTGDLLCALGLVLSNAAALSEAIVTAVDTITRKPAPVSMATPMQRHAEVLKQCLCMAANLDDSLATLLAELGIDMPTGIDSDATLEALRRLLGQQ